MIVVVADVSPLNYVIQIHSQGAADSLVTVSCYRMPYFKSFTIMERRKSCVHG
jgi:hypothetical protein